MDIIKILREQSKVYKDLLKDKISKVKNKNEVYQIHSTLFKDFYSHAYKPIMNKDVTKGKLSLEKIEEAFDRMKSDIGVSYSQLDEISNDISKSYNSNQDYKTGLRNKINYLSNMVSDINIMLEDEDEDSVVFKDSLCNYDFIDKEYSSGKIANISTSNGVATLAINKEENITKEYKDIKISGNGELGNYKIIKKVNITTASGRNDIHARHMSSENPKNNPGSVVDLNASTWVEYQKIGIPADVREKYKFDWGYAEEIRDDLSLRINIELDKERTINLIDISSYIPGKSNAYPILYSIKYSTDGSHYEEIPNQKDLGKRITLSSRAHQEQIMLNDSSQGSFTSQGEITFSPIKTKFIEIILKQDTPYDELLGDYYYVKTIKNDTEIVSQSIISKELVPSYIVKSPPGLYKPK